MARNCQRVWAQGVKDIAERLTDYIPNVEEREKFGESVKNDMLNSDYHLYCMMYKHIHTSFTCRYLVTARKPSVEC